MSDSIVPGEDEYLTTGWEPDLPADDSLVRQAVLAQASWPVEIASSNGRPWRSSERWSGSWLGDRSALTNLVTLKQPLVDPTTTLAEVDELIPPHVPYLFLSPWPTGDLSGSGLTLVGHPPLMVRFPSPADIPAWPGVELRAIHDVDELREAERVLVEGYPIPEMEPLTPGELFGERLLAGPTRVWVADVDGAPAAVSLAHLHPGATLVEYVATLPTARGRGAGAAVTWAATLAVPEAPAMLLASDDGRPVYERMGYRAIERWTAWLRPAAG